MSNVKRYKIEHNWNEGMEVVLEVDHDILTPERAAEINNFWSNHDGREAEAQGVVPAVIRLFGGCAINAMLAEGGAEFGEHQPESQRVWSEDLRSEEGWGGEFDPAHPPTDGRKPYGWCGIRVISACVETADFYSLELKEVSGE